MLGLFTKSDTPSKPASWLARLKDGLKKTGSQFSGVFGTARIDEALFEELERALIASDAGVEATQFLLGSLRERARKRGLETGEQLKAELREILVELLVPLEASLDTALVIRGHKPFIVMVAGVNGSGKTTSIGKLARFFQTQGLSVMLAAGDTFRAAAREQLTAWGEQNGVAVVSQAGGDPGAVIFDAIQAAQARKIDVLLADTAGRLPTQLHLMEELKKIKRVIAKADASAPHEVWLVLDANTGQNALSQVQAFDDALGLTGLVLTKLDGTAKGGVICAIARARSSEARARFSEARAQSSEARARSSEARARSSEARARPTEMQARPTGAQGQSKDPRQKSVPLRFIGVGESIDDLRPFVARDFVAALLD